MDDKEDQEVDLRALIESYFLKGFQYDVILDFLQKEHGVKLSLRTLKRRLQEYGMQKRSKHADDDSNSNLLKEIIREEMRGSGELRGCRSI